MNSKDFDESIMETMKVVENMLIRKGQEYAPEEDRLHNFNKVAEFQGRTRETVLFGFVSKHIQALADMVRRTEDGKDLNMYSGCEWDEKIMDIITYMYILRAIRWDGYKKGEAICANVPSPTNTVSKERR